MFVFEWSMIKYILFCRLRILQNIGAVFVKMGQYSDAMTSYEHVMSEKPSVKAGQLCIVHLCVYSMYKNLMLLLKLCYTTTLIQHTILQQMFY